jgi:serine/threonine-protein kinase RsbW
MTDSSHTAGESAFSIRLDARADHLMLVRQAIEGALTPFGAEPQTVNDIKLAVTEACSNVVKYAYNGDGGPMIVTLRPVGPSLQIVVRDFGKWRDDSQRPVGEISGMGIPLIKSVAESQEILRLDDGTEVSMVFSLDPAGETR